MGGMGGAGPWACDEAVFGGAMTSRSTYDQAFITGVTLVLESLLRESSKNETLSNITSFNAKITNSNNDSETEENQQNDHSHV